MIIGIEAVNHLFRWGQELMLDIFDLLVSKDQIGNMLQLTEARRLGEARWRWQPLENTSGGSQIGSSLHARAIF